MKKLIAMITAGFFVLSVAANFSLAQTNPPVEKPKATCGCGEKCSGEKCECGCHKAKKDEKSKEPAKF